MKSALNKVTSPTAAATRMETDRENRYASTGRNSMRQLTDQTSAIMTARSLAQVPAQLPMGNVSSMNGSVKIKIAPSSHALQSQCAKSISSSRRMLRIKGFKEGIDSQKERFSENVALETEQIKK